MSRQEMIEKAIEFNNGWHRDCAGRHSHKTGWIIRKTLRTGLWVCDRGVGVVNPMLQKGYKTTFSKLNDAKRAVNTFVYENN